MAGLLADHGVTRGSVVCLMLPSSIDYMVAYAAATRLGAITSGINLRLGRARGHLDPRPHPAGGDRGRATATAPGRTVRRRARPLAEVRGDGRIAPDQRGRDLEPSDPVAVVWTSGTTGLPKGAVFDHACLAAVAAGTDVLSEPGDRRLSPLALRPRRIDDPHLGRGRPTG